MCSTSGGGRHRAPGVTRGKRASALAPLYIYLQHTPAATATLWCASAVCGGMTTAMMMFCNKSTNVRV